jgi:hypothetical protein
VAARMKMPSVFATVVPLMSLGGTSTHTLLPAPGPVVTYSR